MNASALVEPGQRWTNAWGTVIETGEISGPKLKPPVAVLMPVEFVDCLVVKGHRPRPGTTFEERRLSFGIEWWRMQGEDEYFETSQAAQAACIDGWPYRCRHCGTYGARRASHRGEGKLPTQEVTFFCPTHADEWEQLLARQYEDRATMLRKVAA